MSEFISPPISSLELLPDELLYEIFEYLSVRDLYDGFYDLNTRFASILASLTNLYADLTTKTEAHAPAVRFFASRITKLSVDHVEPIDFSPFLAIHSLKLSIEPNRSQCQSIQLLSHLEYLSVFHHHIQHFYYSISLSFFVFTNSFPSLHTCRLNLIPFKDKQQWTLVPSLHTLSICLENPRVYAQILHSCPSLVRFRIEFIRHFARPPDTFDDSSHTSLRRFHLCLNCTTLSYCQIINLLLSLVPNLTHFSVRGCSSDANSIDIDQLAIILRQRLPKLRQFYLEMAIIESVIISIGHDDWQRIRKLHPLFNSIKVYPSTQNVPARLIIASKK